MIARTWQPPNVRVTATRKRRKQTWVTCGKSPDEVRRRLEARGWTVERAARFDYREWREKADELTKALIAAYDRGEDLEFDATIWGVMKTHLFELFDRKCAYCESKPLAVEPGDVEHHRPKGRVTEDPQHPGYYWLAYEVDNMLPSCNECNRARGKWNQYPVEEGTRARTAAELDAEKPLLLNPYKDKPLRHLEFDELGDARGSTDKGKRSVEVYGLDREHLMERRLEAQDKLDLKIQVELLERKRPWKEIAKERFDELMRGSDEYAAAQLAHLIRWTRKIAEEKQREADEAARASDSLANALLD
jgi:hypothetical protein